MRYSWKASHVFYEITCALPYVYFCTVNNNHQNMLTRSRKIINRSRAACICISSCLTFPLSSSSSVSPHTSLRISLPSFYFLNYHLHSCLYWLVFTGWPDVLYLMSAMSPFSRSLHSRGLTSSVQHQ